MKSASMKVAVMLASLLSVWSAVALSFTAPAAEVEATRRAAVHSDELMSVGVYYYPEQWPREQWARDFDAVGKLGFQFTHLAEFAWSQIEPREGHFDFAWLDEAIALADQAGLKVILGTPSAAPPAWMDERHPEVYRVDEHGQRHQHGIRAEVSLSNPRYQAFVTRVVEAMARRYGHDPRVWGWQLDNEPGSFADFSEDARRDFQRWLQVRYGTVERLNEAWGGPFWSSNYQHFRQVKVPNAVLAAEDKLSPQALVDVARFRADVTAEFLERQSRTLRRYTDPRQWITSNFTNVSTATDPWRVKDLDFRTFTLYPVQGSNILGGDSYAIGKPANLMEAAAYYGGSRGVFGIMELQPGQVNWGEVNPQPMAGAIRLWMWHAFAAGSSFISTYRYRHPLSGSEMYHEGIVGTDGVTLSRTGREFVEAMQELRAFTAQLDPAASLPKEFDERATAVLWSHDNYWDLETSPQTKLWNTWEVRQGLTLAVRTTGAPMEFISENEDFSRYPFLLVPAYQLVSPQLAQRWRKYVEQGGHLILTARSGQKGADGHFTEGPWSANVLDLIGADLEGFDMLPASAEGHVRVGDSVVPWQRWADIYRPREGTEVLATFTDHSYRDRAAALRRRIGRGTVTVIGVSTEDGLLERTLIRSAYEDAHVAIENLPVGVFMDWRAGAVVYTNYRPEPVTPVVPKGWVRVVGSERLGPAGVAVYRLPRIVTP